MEVISTAVDIFARILYIAMIGRVIFSWLNLGPSNPIYPIAAISYRITEPILAPIRRYTTFGMLDLSPMVAIILISIVRQMIVSLL